MSVNSYLSDLASTLVLSSSEKESITTSVNTLIARLTIYFGSAVTEKVIFGSYPRGTILPRKVDDNSDIDLMVVFDNSNGYLPQTYLNKLKQFAEHYYNTSDIYQSNPTIVLELNHIKFELVPAYYSYLYYIPNKSSGWMISDPNGFNSELTECNKNNIYKVKPLIRLMKHWNIQNNYRNITSYDLEKKLALSLKYSYMNCSSYTDYLLTALDSMRDFYNGSRVDKAKETIRKALKNEEENMPYTAISEIAKAFPEV